MVRYEDVKDHVRNIARKYSRLTSMTAEDMENELWVRFLSKNKKNCYENEAVAITDLKNFAIDLYRADRSKASKAFSYDFQSSISDVLQDNAEDSQINSKLRYTQDEYESFEFIEAMQKLMKEFKVLPEDSKRDAERKKKVYNYVVCKGYLDCGIKYFEDECFRILREEIPTESEIAEFLSDKNCGTDDSILKIVLHIKTGSNSGSIRKMKWEDLANFKSALIEMTIA